MSDIQSDPKSSVRFLATQCSFGKHLCIQADELYDAFRIWLMDNNLPRVSTTWFYRHLRKTMAAKALSLTAFKLGAIQAPTDTGAWLYPRLYRGLTLKSRLVTQRLTDDA
jgi:hypothetical protein